MPKQQGPPVRNYERVSLDEGIENLEDYEPGGFHPVDLFDVLDGRFEVIYKLGFGGIAMVWLCYETDAKRWRAVKINAASHSSDDCAELKVLQVMKENNLTPEQLDEMHIVVPWETFWIDGPNGRHLCSVMPVLGPSLSEWRQHLGVDYDAVDKMCYQFTEGLGFLHGMGIAHGDFRPANILTRLKWHVLDDVDVDEMKYLLDAPGMEEVFTVEGEKSVHAPVEVVTVICWDRLRHLISDDIAIVDFGESYRIGDPPSTMGIPRQYGAPEVVFGGTPTAMSDLWSLAYTLMEFRLGTTIISTISASIWRMERYAGPVPREYRSSAVRIIDEMRAEPLQLPPEDLSNSGNEALPLITGGLDSLNAMNKRRAQGTTYTDPLEIALGSKYMVKQCLQTDDPEQWDSAEWVPHYLLQEEVDLFADLLRGMFKYAPEQRLSAYKALKHNWFKRKQGGHDSVTKGRTGHVILILLVGFGLSFSWLVWSLLKASTTSGWFTHKVMPNKQEEVCIIAAIDAFW